MSGPNPVWQESWMSKCALLKMAFIFFFLFFSAPIFYVIALPWTSVLVPLATRQAVATPTRCHVRGGQQHRNCYDVVRRELLYVYARGSTGACVYGTQWAMFNNAEFQVQSYVPQQECKDKRRIEARSNDSWKECGPCSRSANILMTLISIWDIYICQWNSPYLRVVKSA